MFGSVLSGRMGGVAGADRMMGMFINTLPVRFTLKGVGVLEAMRAAQGVLVDLLKYEQTPLAVAQRCSGLDNAATLFSAMLNFRHSQESVNMLDRSGMVVVEARERTNYPFGVSVDDFGQRFGLNVQTNAAVVDPANIAKYMERAVAEVVESLQSNSHRELLTLHILPNEERQRILDSFNDTKAECPKEALIQELFEQQAERTPEAVAVRYEDQQLTYAQLNARANQLAHRLRAMRDAAGAPLVKPDALVAISVERSLEMVVGLLGILKSGAAYVPVDPEYPQDRIAYVLQDAGAKVLLTQGHLRDGLPSLEAATSGIASSNDGISNEAVHVLLLDDESTYADEPEENIGRQETGQTSGNLAYVIYTSGSTGLPKGVMNEHRGVVNRLCWMPEGFRIGVEDRVLQKTAFGFDVSVWEFFWTLLNGARLVMARPGGHRDPQYLVRTITEQGITMVDFVPSMLQVFLDGLPQGACTSVRHVFSGGEELSLPLQRLCQQKLPASRLHHMYGPTEAAVDATHWACDATQQQGRVPIGRPIANTRIYILDGQGQPVPVGVSGEIHIAGDGVARGYLNQPELTAERFVRDPFSEEVDARMYRTGDLGRWRADGAIEYLGRNDFQVKIRGLRIELGEIEAKISEQPQVREAVVLAREDGAGDRRLVAYVTARADGSSAGDAGQALDVEVLREQLKAVLPGYMVPSAFVVLQEMPLTPNGKVDRKALPAPDLSALQTGAYEAPRDELQEFIASVWGRVLGIDRVGINDNFFDAGGNSLSLIRVHDMLETRLKSGLSVVDLFQYPTILSLSEHIHFLKESGGAVQSGRGMKTDPNQGREPRRSVLRKRKQHA